MIVKMKSAVIMALKARLKHVASAMTRVHRLLLPTFSEKLSWIVTTAFSLTCLTIFMLDFSGLASSFGCKSTCTASN